MPLRGLANTVPACGFQEFKYLRCLIIPRKGGTGRFKPLAEYTIPPEERAIKAAERRDTLFAESAATEADDIDSREACTVADGDSKRNDIAVHSRLRRNHRMVTDTAPLLHRGKAAHHHMVPDPRMASKRCVVRKDGVIADNAVMRDMRRDKEKAVIADNCPHRVNGGAGMHGHMLTDHAVMTDLEG
ncbi:MAG: hypothetical protein VX326_09295 [Pseudomonadota bacterium]|nr:hypothetical protein [Pseudomonadota bacterium]